VSLEAVGEDGEAVDAGTVDIGGGVDWVGDGEDCVF